MADPMSRKQRQKFTNRAEILQVALELFSQQGYEQTTMLQIARRAEFAVGTLYTFFKDKQALYEALVSETLLDVQQELLDALRGGGDELARLERYIDTFAELAVRHVATARLYYKLTAGSLVAPAEGLEGPVREMHDSLLTAIEEILASGVREGRFAPLPPRLMALALAGIVLSFLGELVRHPANTRAEGIASAIKAIFFQPVLLAPRSGPDCMHA